MKYGICGYRHCGFGYCMIQLYFYFYHQRAVLSPQYKKVFYWFGWGKEKIKTVYTNTWLKFGTFKHFHTQIHNVDNHKCHKTQFIQLGLLANDNSGIFVWRVKEHKKIYVMHSWTVWCFNTPIHIVDNHKCHNTYTIYSVGVACK